MEKISCKNCNFISSAAAVLDENQLSILENKCSEVCFKTGEIIFKQDSLSSNIIYLKTGLAKIHMSGGKRDQIIKIAKAPSYLGLPTTFGDKINQYSATAIEDSIACFIDMNAFKEFIYINGEFAYEIIVDVCKNELENHRRCVNRNQKQTTGRLAEALLYFADKVYESEDFDFPLSRNDLADLICSSRESVSRILGDFNNEGLIELTGKRIKILNKELLYQIDRKG